MIKNNKIQLNQDPNFQRKRTLNELQMFNKILSICTSIYWFKHCNVSRSTLFMKAFCRFLTHRSVNYCHSSARNFACTSFHIGGFLFVRYGHKASWVFLAAYFWFCWLLISFPLHHLFCIALSSPWLGKRGLDYMLLSISELQLTLVCSHFCICPFGSMPKVICDSWCLHFIIIIVVL